MERTDGTRVLSFLVLLVLLGCDREAEVEITEPARGSMLPAGQDVVVTGKSESGKVLVNGVETSAGGGWETTVDEVDGLGFVVAEIQGDPLVATRSYHQGTYRPAREAHDDTIRIHVGAGAMVSRDPSIAGLISELLVNEELAGYVDNPLTMTVTVITPINVTVNVDSVTSPDIVVTLNLDGSDLNFHAHMTDVAVDYTATAVALSSSGTALYDTIDVAGQVALTTADVTLSDVVVTASDPAITDSGGLPPAGVEQLATLLADEIPPAIETAASAAADAVFSTLISSIRPEVGLEFSHPIDQDSGPGSVSVGSSLVGLTYWTQIQASEPGVANADHQVLARTTTCDATGTSGIAVTVGSDLVNQLAFAVWDAGNLRGISFSRSELESMGMESLSSPYDRLQDVQIRLLLPPLLEWGDDGPRLDLGGVQVDLSVSGVSDSTAWTAASVPVRLVQVEGDLRIEPDPDREVTIRDVGFDRMNTLADHDKVMRILDTAVPGVVQRVFGDLPTIVLPSMTLTRLDGSDGPVLDARVDSLAEGADCWMLELSLSTP